MYVFNKPFLPNNVIEFSVLGSFSSTYMWRHPQMPKPLSYIDDSRATVPPVGEVRDMLQHLSNLSYRDQLTGAYNRHALTELFGQLAVNSIGVIYCDVTGLKRINDEQGHEAGDRMIQHCCDLLRETVDTELVYRTGGDEFIVIDRESGREAFHACVENALRAMEESHISISCGISWRAERGNIDEQINEADKKMYLAKRDFYACKEHDRRHYWPEQE